MLRYTFDACQGYQYRCVVDIINTSEVFEPKYQTHWTGAFDNHWENPDNWSCNNVLSLSSDILIGNREVIIHSDVSVRTLKIALGGSLKTDSVTILPLPIRG